MSKKRKTDPIEDAVSTWLFQRYDDKLRRARPASDWHGDARGLIAEIKRATNTQKATSTLSERNDNDRRLTLRELLRMIADDFEDT